GISATRRCVSTLNSVEQGPATQGSHHGREPRPVDRARYEQAASAGRTGGQRRTTGRRVHLDDADAAEVLTSGLVSHPVESPRAVGDRRRGQTGRSAVRGDRVEAAVCRRVRAAALVSPQRGRRRGLNEEVEVPGAFATEQVQPPGAGELPAQPFGEVGGGGLGEWLVRQSTGCVDDAANRRQSVTAVIAAITGCCDGGGETGLALNVCAAVYDLCAERAHVAERGRGCGVQVGLRGAAEEEQVTSAAPDEVERHLPSDAAEPAGQYVRRVWMNRQLGLPIGGDGTDPGAEGAAAAYSE